MMKMPKLIATLLAVFALAAHALNPGDDITSAFTDPKFKEAVYDKIGKSDPDPILYSDVRSITELDLSNHSENWHPVTACVGKVIGGML